MPRSLRWWVAEGLRLLANRLDPPEFVWSSQPMSPEKIAELRQEWLRRHGG